MKEQRGVPAYTGEVIRFDQPSSRDIHRAGHSIQHHPEDEPYLTGEMPRRATRSQRPPALADADYATEEPRRARGHSTARRLDRNPLETRVLPRRFDAGRFLVIVGLALLVMLLGFLALSWLGTWWQTQTNDWTFGRPRTFQVDQVVGHQDSPQHPSHFIALNLNRQVLVIELPGGNPAKALIYTGPTLVGDGQDLTPITLTFVDVKGDGKPEMEIHILDQVIVFHNTGSKFVPPSSQP
jgi:hypothetical protein